MAVESEPAQDVAIVRPIFIVGCGRSGTTLLRLMLDSHPAHRGRRGDQVPDRPRTDPWRALAPAPDLRFQSRPGGSSGCARSTAASGRVRGAQGKAPLGREDARLYVPPRSRGPALSRRPVRASDPRRPRRGRLVPRALGLSRPACGPPTRCGASRSCVPAPSGSSCRPIATTSCATRRSSPTLSGSCGPCWRSWERTGMTRCCATTSCRTTPPSGTRTYSAKRRTESGGREGRLPRVGRSRARRKLDPALRAVLMRSSGKLLADLGYTG